MSPTATPRLENVFSCVLIYVEGFLTCLQVKVRVMAFFETSEKKKRREAEVRKLVLAQSRGRLWVWGTLRPVSVMDACS